MLYKDRRLFVIKEEHSRSDGTMGNVSGEGLKADGTRQGAEEITLCDKKPETGAGSLSLTTVFSVKNFLALPKQHQLLRQVPPGPKNLVLGITSSKLYSISVLLF